MIEIVIPTLGRCDSQITLNSLPEKWQKQTTLVVQEHEYDEMVEKYSNVCNVWKLPAGTKGISWTRKHIANKWKGKRIFTMDDDLTFTFCDQSGEKVKRSNPTDQHFDEMFADVEALMNQGFVSGGLGTTTVPPSMERHTYSTRVWTNMFFSENFPVDDIDFGTDYVLLPEDFYVTLQLLTKGYNNVAINWFLASPSATNAKGGCETFRTIENHNEGQRILAEKFPDFVDVRTKIQKSGPWKGQEKLALTIRWKKAYESSHQDPATTLENFF